MSWVKIDDGAPEHPKLLSVGAAAAWLWVCGLAYCNRQKRRDGFIPFAKVKLLYPGLGIKHADALVRAGLWEPAPMGFNVHDYHDYQPDSDQAEAIREARVAAGRLGGKRSAEARAKQTDEANTKQVASSKPKQEPSNDAKQTSTPSRPVPIPAPPDPEDPDPPPGGARVREGDRFGNSFASRYPTGGIEGAETLRKLCESRGLDLENEVGKHRAWALANNRVCLNWLADLELWVRGSKAQRAGALRSCETARERQTRERLERIQRLEAEEKGAAQ